MTDGDKYLIVLIVIISVASMFLMKNDLLNYDEKYISIQVDGKEFKKLIFDKEIVGKKLAVKTEFGYNLIEIGDERVRVIEADCPDKLDVKRGWISNVGESLVCLPNKMVIEIKGHRSKEDIDYLSR